MMIAPVSALPVVIDDLVGEFAQLAKRPMGEQDRGLLKHDLHFLLAL